MLGAEAFSGDAPVSKTGEQGSIPCGPAKPSLADITQAVAEHYGVPRRAIVAKVERCRWSQPRHVAMWLARKHLGKGTPWIGYYLKRDQSTVRYGIGKIDEELSRSMALRGAVAMIERRLGL